MTATDEETTATSAELPSAAVSLSSPRTALYQRSDGPVKGGIGKRVACSENRTRTTTGR